MNPTSGLSTNGDASPPIDAFGHPKGPPPAVPRPDMEKVIAASKSLLSEDSHYPDVIEYLTGRGDDHRHLSMDVLRKYGVGAEPHDFRDAEGKWVKEVCLTFPWMSIDRASNTPLVHRVKVRSVKHKHLQKVVPAGGEWGKC